MPTLVLAQTSDTISEVRVHAHRDKSADTKLNEFSPGQKIHQIDSAVLQQYRMQSMAALLSQQEPVFVKSYGFNGLATLTFRGASAAQSEVLWNGVPIQNAALGMADVSELPVLLINRVNIVYGGSSALWGSGNVGGALMLESARPVFDSGYRRLDVLGSAGSFGQYSGGLAGSMATRRWYFAANALMQSAHDNFPYTTQSGQSARMPNDALASQSVTAQAAYRFSQSSVLSVAAWGQQYVREIPPALFESYSVKKETDGSLRLVADWTKTSESSAWYLKSSFTEDNIVYNDAASEIFTNNTVYQYYQEAGWKKDMHRYGRLLLFAPLQVAWMSIAPGDVKQQNKIAVAGAYDYKAVHDRLDVAVNARAEAINAISVILPGADASFGLTDWLSLRANGQRTYRAPTLNELFYFPGGNTSLKPEQGWSGDAGYSAKLRMGRFSVFHDLSYFDRDIHDWILWLGGAVWTPHNIAEVHSRGVETENKLSLKLTAWEFHIGLNTSYVLATTVASYIPNDGSIGRQIPYTPRYNGQALAGISFKKITINYIETYTGYRFITSDESEYLTPFQTGNVQAAWNTAVNKHSVQLSAQCNNIWNEQYEVVSGRPMPGVNWLAGLRLGIL